MRHVAPAAVSYKMKRTDGTVLKEVQNEEFEVRNGESPA